MYDLANEEDRAGQKAPEKRVDVIMQRLSKDKDSKSMDYFRNKIINFFLYSNRLRS